MTSEHLTQTHENHRAAAEKLLLLPVDGLPAHVVQERLTAALVHAVLAQQPPPYGSLLRLWQEDQDECERWKAKYRRLKRRVKRRHEHPNWNCDDPECPHR